MSNPSDRYYTKDHEWLKPEGDSFIVGITHYAQEELGDIVFVEVPEVGTQMSKGESFATVESVKAVSDIYAPCDGEVIESNTALQDSPELINSAAFGDGWIVKISSKVEPKTELLSVEDYNKLLEEISK
jgi:glycine cleavage system H protein